MKKNLRLAWSKRKDVILFTLKMECHNELESFLKQNSYLYELAFSLDFFRFELCLYAKTCVAKASDYLPYQIIDSLPFLSFRMDKKVLKSVKA